MAACDHAEHLIVQHRRFMLEAGRRRIFGLSARPEARWDAARRARARELAEAYRVALGRAFGGWDDQQLEEGI
jgi:hypothetical protein